MHLAQLPSLILGDCAGCALSQINRPCGACNDKSRDGAEQGLVRERLSDQTPDEACFVALPAIKFAA
ncbi:hypothetical protein [Burkholderia ubonensis]|uniref:hypothetical protein n=1 Tax=Burkholderia ubonensis TaxID=101571 RepID=UPI0016273E65|nr:hypothetical protein [Burkholderia ubonensis]